MTTPSLHQHLFIGLHWDPLASATISQPPVPPPQTLTAVANWHVMMSCFPPSPHHTALQRHSQDLLKPLGPHPLSAASRCLCSALEPSRFLLAASWEGLRRRMRCFIPSSLNRNDPLPFLHFAPCLYSVVAHFTASWTPWLPRSHGVHLLLPSGERSPQTTRNPQQRISLQWRRTLKTKIRAPHLITGF